MFYKSPISSFFFFNDTATTEIYTLSLHDALPILRYKLGENDVADFYEVAWRYSSDGGDRKSTRLNFSHVRISYAVFCLKKKKQRRSTYSNRIYHCSTVQRTRPLKHLAVVLSLVVL